MSPKDSASDWLFSDDRDSVEDLGEYSNKTDWDPSNDQNKYVRPTTSQSVSTSIKRAWKNPSLANSKQAATDVASNLKPTVSDKLGRAVGAAKSARTGFGTLISTNPFAGKGTAYQPQSDDGMQDLQPEPIPYKKGLKHAEDNSRNQQFTKTDSPGRKIPEKRTSIHEADRCNEPQWMSGVHASRETKTREEQDFLKKEMLIKDEAERRRIEKELAEAMTDDLIHRPSRESFLALESSDLFEPKLHTYHEDCHKKLEEQVAREATSGQKAQSSPSDSGF